MNIRSLTASKFQVTLASLLEGFRAPDRASIQTYWKKSEVSYGDRLKLSQESTKLDNLLDHTPYNPDRMIVIGEFVSWVPDLLGGERVRLTDLTKGISTHHSVKLNEAGELVLVDELPPEADDKCYLSVFTYPDNQRASKSFDQDGRRLRSRPTAAYFKAHKIPLRGPDDFFRHIEAISTQPRYLSSYVLRDRFSSLGEELIKQKRLMRRISDAKSQNADKATLLDKPCHYICIDSDGLEIPSELSGASKEEIVEWLRGQLPAPFRDKKCFYQYSSSAFLGGKNLIKLHLWFWLETPIETVKLRDWFRRQEEMGTLRAGAVDTAIYKRANPIYTAAPSIQGGDPLGEKRSGFLLGGDTVTLPPQAYIEDKIREKRKARAQSNREEAEKRGVKLGHYTGPVGSIACDPYAKKSLNRAVRRLTDQTHQRYKAAFREASYVGRFVGAGRVDKSKAVELLMFAASANGSTDKHGHGKMRLQLENGIEAGSADPLYLDKQLGQKEPSLARSYISTPIAKLGTLTRAAVKQGIEAASDDKVTVVNVPTGAGKSYTALEELVRLNQAGQTVAFAAPTHAMIENEIIPMLQARGIEPLHLKGQKRSCQWYQKAQNKPALDEIYEDRRVTDFCHVINKGSACPYAATCPLKMTPPSKDGRFIVTVHAVISQDPKLPDDCLVVIDESPSLVYSSSVPFSSLRALGYENKVGTRALTPSEEWRERNPELVRFSRDVVAWIKEVQPELSRWPEPIPLRAPEDERLICRARAALERLGSEEAKIKSLSPSSLIKQLDLDLERSSDLISKRSINLLQTLARAICDNQGDVALSWSQGKPTLMIEKRYSLKLPSRPVVVLDATAPKQTWRSWAGMNTRKVEFIESDIKPALRRAHLIKTSLFQTPTLWDGEQLSDEYHNRVERIAHEIRGQLETLPDEAKVLVAMSKRLREHYRLHGFCKTLSSVFNRFKVKVGHTGLDHVGSNEYKDVSAVVILGAQRSYYGGLKADTHFLSSEEITEEEVAEIIKESENATHAQWWGRARALRRPDEDIRLVLVGGSEFPLPELVWSRSVIHGRARSSEHEEAAINILNNGWLTRGALIDLGIKKDTASRLINRLVARYELYSETVQNGSSRPIERFCLQHKLKALKEPDKEEKNSFNNSRLDLFAISPSISINKRECAIKSKRLEIIEENQSHHSSKDHLLTGGLAGDMHRPFFNWSSLPSPPDEAPIQRDEHFRNPLKYEQSTSLLMSY